MLRTLPALVSLLAAAASPQEPAPQEARPGAREPVLQTRWTAGVTPDGAHREYPRMQMRRSRWHDLDGTWEYAVRPRQDGPPRSFDGGILVPFPIESALSGVGRRVGPDQRLWYRRAFSLPDRPSGQRLLLHFGAVDWHAEVWCNGIRAGEHSGGYDPFTFDVTAMLRDGEQELLVAVWDPTERGPQPRGKQTSEPGGIWYTPTTGIWQTVWLEPVPEPCHLRGLRIETDPDSGEVTVQAEITGPHADLALRGVASLEGGEVAGATGEPGTGRVELTVPDPQPWSPERPTLYDLRVELCRGDRVLDAVESYFGLRSVGVGEAADGHVRLFLNGEPLFQYGLLDQGFWPDGLYTPPGDEALRHDIEIAKELGFNMLRKHVKVEPDRFYYWCDRLGMLVWQDMPNGDRHIGRRDEDLDRGPLSAFHFERELRAMVDALRNHPSIVTWVPFNEGWGQYDTVRIARWLAEYDPTRLVDATSGWADRGMGDMHDVHAYPGPAMPDPEPARAAVLGEFGGLGLPVAGHTWQDEANWGYRSYTDSTKLTDAYVELVERLRWLQADGLAAAVYTQLTDVEIEVNGLLTYDREVIKPDRRRLVAANRELYRPPPGIRILLPTSRLRPRTWRYTMQPPGEGWQQTGFEDGDWSEGPGGFGTKETPGAVVGTVWDGERIWLRQAFDVPGGDPAGDLYLRIHHDEDAEVYLNGVPAARLEGYTTAYVLVPVDAVAAATLRPTGNLLAVRCSQTRGGQFLDAGLVSVKKR